MEGHQVLRWFFLNLELYRPYGVEQSSIKSLDCGSSKVNFTKDALPFNYAFKKDITFWSIIY